MRLGLGQHLRTEQRLVQSPQMIQAMQILQCPMMELQDQIEHELEDNVFLEIATEQESDDQALDGPLSAEDAASDQTFDEDLHAQYAAELEQLEGRSSGSSKTPIGSSEESERRLEVLNNTPDLAGSLSDHLLDQVRVQQLQPELTRVIEHVIYSLDDDGRLTETTEQVASDLAVPIPLAEEAVGVVRQLDPRGVGARDLKDCLLL